MGGIFNIANDTVRTTIALAFVPDSEHDRIKAALDAGKVEPVVIEFPASDTQEHYIILRDRIIDEETITQIIETKNQVVGYFRNIESSTLIHPNPRLTVLNPNRSPQEFLVDNTLQNQTFAIPDDSEEINIIFLYDDTVNANDISHNYNIERMQNALNYISRLNHMGIRWKIHPRQIDTTLLSTTEDIITDEIEKNIDDAMDDLGFDDEIVIPVFNFAYHVPGISRSAHLRIGDYEYIIGSGFFNNVVLLLHELHHYLGLNEDYSVDDGDTSVGAQLLRENIMYNSGLLVHVGIDTNQLLRGTSNMPLTFDSKNFFPRIEYDGVVDEWVDLPV